jgi:hypothetical protein
LARGRRGGRSTADQDQSAGKTDVFLNIAIRIPVPTVKF